MSAAPRGTITGAADQSFGVLTHRSGASTISRYRPSDLRLIPMALSGTLGTSGLQGVWTGDSWRYWAFSADPGRGELRVQPIECRP